MDSLLSLAFSMQSNRGVYALLLGSGVSRAAKIPTGWEVVLELTKKLALLSSEDCEPDPEAWYIQKYGSAPDYAVLLDQVAKTPTERQQLLRAYFEPTAEEKEEKAKQPTAAHHAIARLAADGFIKVIITTNFDRLMELALQEAGVAPHVLSTPDQIEGALPLVHTQCCIIKVHGDYLDTRIKNTPTELDDYDARMKGLLDQIFDQFGLITCGWSADWDVALRAAIERAPSRRFTTYWASRGTPSEAAARLIKLRAGQLISISDADSFFTSLQEKVEALERFSEPHPLSVKIAVASTKKYLAEDRYRIRLYDLIDEECTRVIGKLNSSDLGNVNINAPITSTELTTRVRKYEAVCKPLIAIAATCGQWGGSQSAEIWQRTQQRLYSTMGTSGNTLLHEYQRYPITLITYAACLGAISSGNLGFISTLVQTKLRKKDTLEKIAIDIVPPCCMLQQPKEWGGLLEGMSNRHLPLNDWLHNTLFDYLGEVFPSGDAFTIAFDRVEVLLALAFGKHGERSFQKTWRPPGCFGFRRENMNLIIAEITNSLTVLDAESPFVKSNLFGDTVGECNEQLSIFSEFIGKLHWH
ncbi:MAG: SIR2 family protein [Methylotenera sp.]